MRKFGFALVFATVVFVLTVFSNVLAASDEILVGTPEIDGFVDDIYHQSLILETGVGENAYNGGWEEATGSIYFLYDDKYLYICADIKDNDVVSVGEDFVKNTDNPHKNDCCEFRLSLDGGTTTFKVGIDAYGYRAYGIDETLFDYSKIIYKTTINETGYVIECAIPCTEGILNLSAQDILGFKLQLNDLSDQTYVYFATDYSGEGAKGLVYYNLSSTAVIKSAPETTEKTVAETDVPAATTIPDAIDATATVTSPKTGDKTGIILMTTVLISALALSFIKRKKV